MVLNTRIIRQISQWCLFGSIIHTLILAISWLAFGTTHDSIRQMVLLFAPMSLLWAILWLYFLLLFKAQEQKADYQLHLKQSNLSEQLFKTHQQVLLTAQKRYRIFTQQAFHISSAIIGIYQVILLAIWFKNFHHTVHTEASAVLLLLISLMSVVSFLLAKYLWVFSKQAAWVLLRSIACGYFVIAWWMMLLLLRLVLPFDEKLLHTVWQSCLIIIVLILTAELLIYWGLNFYRLVPEGFFARPAFDSRIVESIIGRQSLKKTISEFLEYQFGVAIDQYRFYQRFIYWAPVFLLFSTLVIWLSTTVAVVGSSQCGTLVRKGVINQSCAVFKPGVYLKSPWPLSVMKKFDVSQLNTIEVGVPVDQQVAQYFLTPSDNQQLSTESLGSVDFLTFNARLTYQIDQKHLVAYLNCQQQLKTLLKHILLRSLTHRCASYSLDELLSYKRNDIEQQLLQQLQKKITPQQYGIEVRQFSFNTLKPPQAIAEKFYEPIGAKIDWQAIHEKAQVQSYQILTEIAGSPEQAEQIYQAIVAYQKMQQSEQPIDANQLTKQLASIDSLMLTSGGQIAQQISQARAYYWQLISRELQHANYMASQLAIYRRLPDYYRQRMALQALSASLAMRPKIILKSRQNRVSVRLKLTESGDVSVPFEENGIQ